MDLGFAEPFPKKWMSKSKYFPSKIGGKPTFLVLNPVLGPEQLSCPKCKKTMRFMLQLYAPIDSNDQAFHRHLFIFVCGQSDECSNQFLVFRCQLTKDNKFYSKDPPDYEEDLEDYDPNPEKFGLSLCPVCGVHADKHCGQCLGTQYCSREHQLIHWKKGGHKNVCQKMKIETEENENDSIKYKNIVFPEFEIVIEEDNLPDKEENDDNEVTELEMKKYKDFLQKNKPKFQNENMEPYIDEKDDEEQKTFEKFKKTTSRGEIIRYCTDWHDEDLVEQLTSKILWISNKNRLTDIPKCENCGSERRFEFQIMPTILNKILSKDKNDKEFDSLDFGTLLIFSCPKSCVKQEQNEKNVTDFYLPEFIYNQSIC